MTPQPPSVLRLPSFLQGTYSSVQQKVRREGLRCGTQYREDGSFPAPRQMLELPPGQIILAHEVTDFQRELPAWRLYMVSNLMVALSQSPQKKHDPFPVRTDYETVFRETAWGALFFLTSHMYPMSAERTAQRLQAALRFWEPLQPSRYLFKKLGTVLTFEELMSAACGWALDAWDPGGAGAVYERLEKVARRMAQATREDCIEVILQRIPYALEHAGKLTHRSVVADPVFQRERLGVLNQRSFDMISGVYTGDLIGQLVDWDRQLDTN